MYLYDSRDFAVLVRNSANVVFIYRRLLRVNDVAVVCNLKLISQAYWHKDGWT